MMTLLCAQDCFEKANQFFSRGHYLDAQAFYDRAYALDPHCQIYADARQRLPNMVLAFSGKSFKPSGADSGDCSTSCCECCGEACGEGCCEALCDGCDCG